MHSATRQILAGILVYFLSIFQVFGQAALLPDAKQQYLDNNGKPLASGTVTYYVPGTSQKKTTWQNSTQTVNNTNPVNLDIGGRGVMFGQGSYRQVVQDSLGNTVWDATTTAYGASQPSGATGTDTAPVGSVMAYSGFVVPTNWQLAAGQALSRTTFAALMQAITIQATNISCTNTSTTLTGFTDTSLIRIGAPIEATCLPTSTTVASITNATTIVVSQAAAATSTVTATIFPWGNGDQVSTFNVPDLRGRAPVGADCMNFVALGSTCAENLTATYYGANPGAAGQAGGTQSKNLTIANINAFTPTGTISTITPSGSVAVSASSNLNGFITPGSNVGVGGANSGGQSTVINGNLSGTFTGTPVTPTFTGNSLGSGTAHSVVNPDATVNYIIKVAPNSTGAGGVVSFGGMFGDIVCASSLTCAPVGGVNTVGCTSASTSQIGCVQPDGITIKVVGGQLTAIAGVASSIGVGSTAVTGGINGEILSINAGSLGQIATSGSGSVALTNSPTFVTPTLGAATATTINTNTFTAGGYTLAGTSGKTLTFQNTLTLAGIDSTTLTFQGTDIYVGRSTTDTLTNKTLNCNNNTCTVRLGSDVTGNLPLNNLATGSLDQVIGYFGSTLGNAIPINNCSNALTYSTSTHTFGCNASAGTGTVTSITPGGGLVSSITAGYSQSAITSSGTISGAQSVNSQTGTSYTFVDGDRAKLVTGSNASAQAYSLPQAGAASAFVSGWFVDIVNVSSSASGIITITPTTSTINGSSSLKIQPGQSAHIVSDGTNYQVSFLGSASQLPGSATNDSANSGNLGEFISSSVGSGGAVSVTSGASANVTNVTLPAGDWDCRGNVSTLNNTNVTGLRAWISTTSATDPNPPNNGSYAAFQGTTFNNNIVLPTGTIRFSFSGSNAVFLSANNNFSTGTGSIYGFIGCRRVR